MTRHLRPAFLSLCLAGCAFSPPAGLAPSDTELENRLGANVRDLREPFAAALCDLLKPAEMSCETVLAKVESRRSPSLRPSPANQSPEAQTFRIGIVPGLFASCLPAQIRPLSDAARHLRGKGYEVIELDVNGRGSIASNGQQIARQLRSLPDDPRRLLLFGYSKGLIDILQALAQTPDLQRRVAAVVGWAGAAHGSLLAERMESLYTQVLAPFAIGQCSPSDGAEVHDLTPDSRRQWWADNTPAIQVPMYSLVGLPSADGLSAGLRTGYSWLAGFDPRNDGQLRWRDAIMTPGALLGFVNADHWGIGVAVTEHWPLLKPVIRDNVPRGPLMEAAIQVITADLARPR